MWGRETEREGRESKGWVLHCLVVYRCHGRLLGIPGQVRIVCWVLPIALHVDSDIWIGLLILDFTRASFSKMAVVVEPVLPLRPWQREQSLGFRNSGKEQLSIMKTGEILTGISRTGTWEVWCRGSRFCRGGLSSLGYKHSWFFSNFEEDTALDISEYQKVCLLCVCALHFALVPVFAYFNPYDRDGKGKWSVWTPTPDLSGAK